MKRIFILLPLALILACPIKAQIIDTVYLDENSNITLSKHYKYYRLFTKVGDIVKVTDYYKNDKIYMTGGYKDFDFFLPTGPFFYYNRNNNVREVKVFEPHLYPYIQAEINKSGTLYSSNTDSLILMAFYHKNGNIKCIGYGLDYCTQQGTWIYFDKKGILKYKIDLVNDVPNGKYEFYYSNGALFIEGNIKDGESIGDFEQYWPDGKHWKTIHYLDGKKVKVIR